MKNINKNDIYVLNPAYKFRNDVKRVFITNNNSLYCDTISKQEDYETNFSSIIHPMTAFIFSFFNGEKTLNYIIKELQELLDLSYNEIEKTILLVIENTESIILPIDEKHYTSIPKKFLIKNTDFIKRKLINDHDLTKMMNDIDFSSVRFYIPNDITIMINNTCITDCVYCYANISHKAESLLSFERVKELISEAHKLGCRDVMINGGEFFLYKKWEELIEVLRQNEFEPYISTKYPLDENRIKKLKKLNIKWIQISLDSIIPEEITKMLNVDRMYLEKMMKSFQLLEKYNIGVRIKSVITKYNDSVESVKKLIDFLVQFKNLTEVSIAPADHSIYKAFTYPSTKKNLEKISDYIDTLKGSYPDISIQGYSQPTGSIDEKLKKHNKRNVCSGNVSSFFILPDGKVTICEQMYWQPFFILGDVTKQSLTEVWNSKKALSLWNISQEEIQESSPCKTCKEFDECRRGAGSCWRAAIQAYGNDNYDYPYPDCPYAPEVTLPYYIQ